MKYTGRKLNEIRFPLGGIGTGSICLAGNGLLVDWEIFNRPNKGSINDYSGFAVRAQYPDGRVVTKMLLGDLNTELTGRYRKSHRHTGYGFGPVLGTMCGLPHFRKVQFDGTFPMATLTFEDEDFPAKVFLKAFNPFIPLNAEDSSIPAALFDVSVCSREEGVTYTVVFSVRNPFDAAVNTKVENEKYTAITLKHGGVSSEHKNYGDVTVTIDRRDGIAQEYWYRGGWRDSITTFWHDLTTGSMRPRRYDTSGNYTKPDHGDVCSVGATALVEKEKCESFRFALSWNVPHCYNYWNPVKDEAGEDILWKNYYATRFEDSVASGLYCLENWDRLYKGTDRFRRSLHGSSLDKAVIDAVSSTLSVLKSPTVLRLEDGTFYAWEGVGELDGSCEGTCTHVWSYAYALCFLFPELERSMRDTELTYDTQPDGRMYFRTALPLGKNGYVVQPPCVDGQMATLIKVYRDWKLTGDDAWLRDNWESLKKVLEYAWSEDNAYEWDRDKDGVLEGRQHHTLDMELFGPSSWLQSMYLAALKAAAEMAAYLGEPEKAAEYTDLFEKGYAWTRDNLFNGKYFFQKVDLKNKGYTEHFTCPDYWNEEQDELKYQIGEGSAIDQMLGQWHAAVCGLGDIFDKTQRRKALESMMKTNFRPSMRDIANVWRVFALNDEGGTIICDYPQGSTRPVIPIPYCDECMTGFEYAFAGLLLSEGMVEECLQIVRAIRDRYDGEKRDPYNEIECGSNYARPMASFALLPLFSGFTFDLPGKEIGFMPRLSGDFRCMWNLGTGWGDYIRTDNVHRITVADGILPVTKVTLGGLGKAKAVKIDGKYVTFTQSGDTISVDTTGIKKELRVEA